VLRRKNISWLSGVSFAAKNQGGQGIHDIEVKNMALLKKWLFRLLTKDGVWQTLLRRKYVGSKALSQVLWKPGDSHFWAGLMATKKHFFGHEIFSIKDGSEVRGTWYPPTSIANVWELGTWYQ
jgi:hypothetical protein